MLISLLMGAALFVAAGPDTLEAVDVFGARRVSADVVRRAIGVVAGDRTPETLDAVRSRVLRIPGVAEADVSVVCCGERGGALLYVGIRERDVPAPVFGPTPRRTVVLPDSVTALGRRFDMALREAVRRGVTGEDATEGYALGEDTTVRAIQRQFRELARTHVDTLRRVLRESRDAGQRALAAQIVAYAHDRQAVARTLGDAVRDPDERVRNNAVRALALLAQWANEHPAERLVIPWGPFIDFLHSAQWTDRNKAVFALMPLTASGDRALLDTLRRTALPSLAEMARWANPGHALPAYLVLARVAGLSETEAFTAWTQGRREEIIRRATGGTR